jgi:hypothetical protein
MLKAKVILFIRECVRKSMEVKRRGYGLARRGDLVA